MGEQILPLPHACGDRFLRQKTVDQVAAWSDICLGFKDSEGHHEQA